MIRHLSYKRVLLLCLSLSPAVSENLGAIRQETIASAGAWASRAGFAISLGGNLISWLATQNTPLSPWCASVKATHFSPEVQRFFAYGLLASTICWGFAEYLKAVRPQRHPQPPPINGGQQPGAAVDRNGNRNGNGAKPVAPAPLPQPQPPDPDKKQEAEQKAHNAAPEKLALAQDLASLEQYWCPRIAGGPGGPAGNNPAGKLMPPPPTPKWFSAKCAELQLHAQADPKLTVETGEALLSIIQGFLQKLGNTLSLDTLASWQQQFPLDQRPTWLTRAWGQKAESLCISIAQHITELSKALKERGKKPQQQADLEQKRQNEQPQNVHHKDQLIPSVVSPDDGLDLVDGPAAPGGPPARQHMPPQPPLLKPVSPAASPAGVQPPNPSANNLNQANKPHAAFPLSPSPVPPLAPLNGLYQPSDALKGPGPDALLAYGPQHVDGNEQPVSVDVPLNQIPHHNPVAPLLSNNLPKQVQSPVKIFDPGEEKALAHLEAQAKWVRDNIASIISNDATAIKTAQAYVEALKAYQKLFEENPHALPKNKREDWHQFTNNEYNYWHGKVFVDNNKNLTLKQVYDSIRSCSTRVLCIQRGDFDDPLPNAPLPKPFLAPQGAGHGDAEVKRAQNRNDSDYLATITTLLAGNQTLATKAVRFCASHNLFEKRSTTRKQMRAFTAAFLVGVLGDQASDAQQITALSTILATKNGAEPIEEELKKLPNTIFHNAHSRGVGFMMGSFNEHITEALKKPAIFQELNTYIEEIRLLGGMKAIPAFLEKNRVSCCLASGNLTPELNNARNCVLLFLNNYARMYDQNDVGIMEGIGEFSKDLSYFTEEFLPIITQDTWRQFITVDLNALEQDLLPYLPAYARPFKQPLQIFINHLIKNNCLKAKNEQPSGKLHAKAKENDADHKAHHAQNNQAQPSYLSLAQAYKDAYKSFYVNGLEYDSGNPCPPAFLQEFFKNQDCERWIRCAEQLPEERVFNERWQKDTQALEEAELKKIQGFKPLLNTFLKEIQSRKPQIRALGKKVAPNENSDEESDQDSEPKKKKKKQDKKMKRKRAHKAKKKTQSYSEASDEDSDHVPKTKQKPQKPMSSDDDAQSDLDKKSSRAYKNISRKPRMRHRAAPEEAPSVPTPPLSYPEIEGVIQKANDMLKAQVDALNTQITQRIKRVQQKERTTALQDYINKHLEEYARCYTQWKDAPRQAVSATGEEDFQMPAYLKILQDGAFEAFAKELTTFGFTPEQLKGIEAYVLLSQMKWTDKPDLARSFLTTFQPTLKDLLACNLPNNLNQQLRGEIRRLATIGRVQRTYKALYDTP